MNAVVTRTAIAGHIRHAFSSGGAASRSELLAAAASTQAPPPVLHRLGELPDGNFKTLRDLWRQMPDVPVE